MATTKGQRIGIWVIAGTMMVGTIGGFVAMMVAPGNEAREQAQLQEAQEKFDAERKAVVEKRKAQSGEYVAQFSEYISRPSAFSAEGIDELKTEDLVVGDGEEITNTTSVGIFYLGWNPDGKLFDSSFNDDKTELIGPTHRSAEGSWSFPNDDYAQPGSVIEGWQEGVIGMKVGGVRELTIPAAMAYGETGKGEDIPPNTPLKFIVMAVPSIPEPETPQIIKDYYKRLYNVDF